MKKYKYAENDVTTTLIEAVIGKEHMPLYNFASLIFYIRSTTTPEDILNSPDQKETFEIPTALVEIFDKFDHDLTSIEKTRSRSGLLKSFIIKGIEAYVNEFSENLANWHNDQTTKLINVIGWTEDPDDGSKLEGENKPSRPE